MYSSGCRCAGREVQEEAAGGVRLTARRALEYYRQCQRAHRSGQVCTIYIYCTADGDTHTHTQTHTHTHAHTHTHFCT